jgi:Holliday junction resolvase RusA-like endonuclease
VTLLRFTVQGPPVPKARARVVARKGEKARSYTPESTAAYEKLIGMHALAAVSKTPGWRTDWAAYALTVMVYRDVRRGDADNFAKAVSDGMNKIAYLDDAAITSLRVDLIDGDERPRVEIEVRMLGDVARKVRRPKPTRAQRTMFEAR